jgi:ABC-type lipoprotein release transport system permease subunit
LFSPLVTPYGQQIHGLGAKDDNRSNPSRKVRPVNVWQLVVREIKHRKLNFTLMLSTVMIAIASLVGAQVILRGGEIETRQILKTKHAEVSKSIEKHTNEVEVAGKALSDATRKEMLKLGFNVLIVPETQDLSELHLNGTLTETMPESYTEKLATSSIITVNHLLPCVTKRIKWPEQDNLDVILYGTRGEVPIHHRKLKKPLLAAVPPGTMVVGYEIHQKLGLKVDDIVTLMDKEFTVKLLHPSRGSADDVTVWIDLKQAQELLGMENVINAILALECGCAGDRISQIRAEIEGVLPGTHVIERFSQAVTRAEMREKVKQSAEKSLEQAKADGAEILTSEKQLRVGIESQNEDLANMFVVFALLGAAAVIGVLAIANVRHREGEIGILRAIGLRSNQILILFLSKALLIGIAGGLLGCCLGLAIGIPASSQSFSIDSLSALFESTAVVLTISLGPLLAPVLAAIGSWIPSTIAASKDPATVLQHN